MGCSRETLISEDMTEEALVDMLLPVKIDPIDRGLPTDVDKARIAAKLREPGCADDARRSTTRWP